jgi:hypothetical protein
MSTIEDKPCLPPPTKGFPKMRVRSEAGVPIFHIWHNCCYNIRSGGRDIDKSYRAGYHS